MPKILSASPRPRSQPRLDGPYAASSRLRARITTLNDDLFVYFARNFIQEDKTTLVAFSAADKRKRRLVGQMYEKARLSHECGKLKEAEPAMRLPLMKKLLSEISLTSIRSILPRDESGEPINTQILTGLELCDTLLAVASAMLDLRKGEDVREIIDTILLHAKSLVNRVQRQTILLRLVEVAPDISYWRQLVEVFDRFIHFANVATLDDETKLTVLSAFARQIRNIPVDKRWSVYDMLRAEAERDGGRDGNRRYAVAASVIHALPSSPDRPTARDVFESLREVARNSMGMQRARILAASSGAIGHCPQTERRGLLEESSDTRAASTDEEKAELFKLFLEQFVAIENSPVASYGLDHIYAWTGLRCILGEVQLLSVKSRLGIYRQLARVIGAIHSESVNHLNVFGAESVIDRRHDVYMFRSCMEKVSADDELDSVQKLGVFHAFALHCLAYSSHGAARLIPDLLMKVTDTWKDNDEDVRSAGSQVLLALAQAVSHVMQAVQSKYIMNILLAVVRAQDAVQGRIYCALLQHVASMQAPEETSGFVGIHVLVSLRSLPLAERPAVLQAAVAYARSLNEPERRQYCCGILEHTAEIRSAAERIKILGSLMKVISQFGASSRELILCSAISHIRRLDLPGQMALYVNLTSRVEENFIPGPIFRLALELVSRAGSNDAQQNLKIRTHVVYYIARNFFRLSVEEKPAMLEETLDYIDTRWRCMNEQQLLLTVAVATNLFNFINSKECLAKLCDRLARFGGREALRMLTSALNSVNADGKERILYAVLRQLHAGEMTILNVMLLCSVGHAICALEKEDMTRERKNAVRSEFEMLAARFKSHVWHGPDCSVQNEQRILGSINEVLSKLKY